MIAREIARGVEHQLNARVTETLLPRRRGEVDLNLRVGTPGKPPRPAPSGRDSLRAVAGFLRTLFMERRDAQREGVLDFTARFDFEGGLSLERGRPYRVGRIDFLGNRHYSDGLVRRHFVLDEGAVFDERLLRQSIARLNRSGMFEPIENATCWSAATRYPASRHHAAADRAEARGVEHLGTVALARLHQRADTEMGDLCRFRQRVRVVAEAPESAEALHAGVRDPAPVYARRRMEERLLDRAAGRLERRRIGYVATQVQQRLLPRISGERSAEPVLPVTGDVTMSCEANQTLRTRPHRRYAWRLAIAWARSEWASQRDMTRQDPRRLEDHGTGFNDACISIMPFRFVPHLWP